MVRIGTSGWVYPHWRGVFYPQDLRQKDWFAHYSHHFDTVEVNNTFYRQPRPAVFDKWRGQAPAGFVYAVKANRYLTHIKRLLDPEEPLRTFFEGAAELKEKIGPVLYQLPPKFPPDLTRFRRFLDALPEGYAHAVEFRDARWQTEEVFALLEEYGVAHCIHDRRNLNVPLRVTASPAYIRLHGDSAPGGDYTEAMLGTWAERIREWKDRGLDVYMYFNNDWEGNAIRNATSLIDLLGK